MRLPERKFGSETRILASQEDRILSPYFSSSMPELNLDTFEIPLKYWDICDHGQSSNHFFSSTDSINEGWLNERKPSVLDFREQISPERAVWTHKNKLDNLEFLWGKKCNKLANKFNVHFNKMIKTAMPECPSINYINHAWKDLQSRPSDNPNFQERKFPKSEPKIVCRPPSASTLRSSTSDGAPQKKKDPQRKQKSVTWNESIEVYSKDRKIIQPLVEHEYLSQCLGDEYKQQREIWLRERSFEQRQNAYNRCKVFSTDSEPSSSDDDLFYDTSNPNLILTSAE